MGMSTRRWGMRRGFVGMIVAVALASGLVVSAQTVEAAERADFDPGHIISDSVFYDGRALSEAQVQNYLDKLGNPCSSGYTCLAQYRQTTTNRSADSMCAAYSGAPNESAARIIHKVGLACGISQKVLIVLLEKEQSLVTTRTPSQSRYDRATGYACPDTAPCDTQYFGFFNQVYKAAWQFKRYGNPAGTSKFFTWYPVGSTSNVGFHPNAACGSGAVRIKNAATAALYYYTPYQPNSAAMGNLYGTGDSCSSYGNRNFWRLFSDWFGATTDLAHAAVDSITGVWGGIRVSGWAKAPSGDSPQYVWIDVDGSGTPVLAKDRLSWFPASFPGYGPNHGFNTVIPASPGRHEVCVSEAASSTLIRCENVTVPRGTGHLDSATGVRGGIQVTGWSVDASATSTSYIWVNVDGVGGPFATNRTFSWLPTLFPGVSPKQGFDVIAQADPGRHEVCVHGVESVIGCSTVDVPYGTGHLDSVTARPGRLDVSGWYVDYTRTDGSLIWVNVDGQGRSYNTNTELSWLAGYLPGAGTNHGYRLSIPAKKGPHTVCSYGARNGQLLGCRAVTVPYSAAGHLDSVTAVAGGVQVTGWSVDLTTSNPSYIWVNVNGVGGPQRADKPLSWFEGLYPGAGANHGFDSIIPTRPGTHEVCVHGTDALLGCSTVTVR